MAPPPTPTSVGVQLIVAWLLPRMMVSLFAGTRLKSTAPKPTDGVP